MSTSTPPEASPFDNGARNAWGVYLPTSEPHRPAPAPANGTHYALGELQALVGGYIELVPIPVKDWILVVGEEGRLKGLEPNRWATMIAGQPIVGNALYIKESLMR